MDAEKGKRAGCKKHKKQESRAEQGTEIMGNNLVTLGATWQERDPISEILRKGREGRRGEATQQQQKNPNQNKISGHIYPPSPLSATFRCSPVRRNRPTPDCPLTGPRHYIFECVRRGGEDFPGAICTTICQEPQFRWIALDGLHRSLSLVDLHSVKDVGHPPFPASSNCHAPVAAAIGGGAGSIGRNLAVQ